MILKTAFHALKTNGILFLAERAKEEPRAGLPLEIVKDIEHTGVEVTHFLKFGSRDEGKRFSEQFLARKCKKEDDYNPKDFLNCLRDIKRN